MQLHISRSSKRVEALTHLLLFKDHNRLPKLLTALKAAPDLRAEFEQRARVGQDGIPPHTWPAGCTENSTWTKHPNKGCVGDMEAIVKDESTRGQGVSFCKEKCHALGWAGCNAYVYHFSFEEWRCSFFRGNITLTSINDDDGRECYIADEVDAVHRFWRPGQLEHVLSDRLFKTGAVGALEGPIRTQWGVQLVLILERNGQVAFSCLPGKTANCTHKELDYMREWGPRGHEEKHAEFTRISTDDTLRTEDEVPWLGTRMQILRHYITNPDLANFVPEDDEAQNVADEDEGEGEGGVSNSADTKPQELANTEPAPSHTEPAPADAEPAPADAEPKVPHNGNAHDEL